MKRRDHFDVLRRREDLFCDKCACRMRDGVVDVKDIEIMIFCDIDHLAGERISVEREIK